MSDALGCMPLVLCDNGLYSVAISGHEVRTIVDREMVELTRKTVPGTKFNLAHLKFEDRLLPVLVLDYLVGQARTSSVTRFMIIHSVSGQVVCAVGIGGEMDILQAPLLDIYPLPMFFDRKTAAPLFWGIWENKAKNNEDRSGATVLLTFERVVHMSDLVGAILSSRQVVSHG